MAGWEGAEAGSQEVQRQGQLQPCCVAATLPPLLLPLPPPQAGLVALLPATDSGVWRIRGGNSRLSPAVLRAANATVHCPAGVTAVRRLEDGRFQLELAASAQEGAAAQGGAAQQQQAAAARQDAEEPFDAVILATPLEGSGISLEGLPEKPLLPARKYLQVGGWVAEGQRGGEGGEASQAGDHCHCVLPTCTAPHMGHQVFLQQHVQVVTTIVKGSVRPSYFGLIQMTYCEPRWSGWGLRGGW